MILLKQYYSMVLFTFQSGVKWKLEMLLKLDFDHFCGGGGGGGRFMFIWQILFLWKNSFESFQPCNRSAAVKKVIR